MLDVLARPRAGAPLWLGPQVPSLSRALAACSMNSGPSSGNCATHSLTTRITVLLGAEGNSAAISSATSSSANSMAPPPAPSDCDLLRPAATHLADPTHVEVAMPPVHAVRALSRLLHARRTSFRAGSVGLCRLFYDSRPRRGGAILVCCPDNRSPHPAGHRPCTSHAQPPVPSWKALRRVPPPPALLRRPGHRCDFHHRLDDR